MTASARSKVDESSIELISSSMVWASAMPRVERFARKALSFSARRKPYRRGFLYALPGAASALGIGQFLLQFLLLQPKGIDDREGDGEANPKSPRKVPH